MKPHVTASKLVVALGIIATSICIFSFGQTDTTKQKMFQKERKEYNDDTTSPRKRNMDELRMGELDAILRHLNEQTKQLDIQVKKLDQQKIDHQIGAALEKIGTDKIEKEINASLSKIDWQKVESAMKQAMDQIQEIDRDKINAEMNKAKTELEKQKGNIHFNSQEIQKNVKRALADAQVSMEKNRLEIQGMQQLTNELHNDGLIDRTKPFKIQVKDGELYINDKKQPKTVRDKYRNISKKDNYTIDSGGTHKK